jgi:hypothetical protein
VTSNILMPRMSVIQPIRATTQWPTSELPGAIADQYGKADDDADHAEEEHKRLVVGKLRCEVDLA